MNFISYSDCPISINGDDYYATSASLATAANLNSNKLIDGTIAGYSATSQTRDSVNIDYFVTGENENILSFEKFLRNIKDHF